MRARTVAWISLMLAVFSASLPSETVADGYRPEWKKEKGNKQVGSTLDRAYVALQAWKAAITDDPLGITDTWVGYDVCSYRGVFCEQLKSGDTVVAGIDLNHGDLAGTLVEELGCLTDLALFHINSNRFTGSLPSSFRKLCKLAELDISNNLFCGFFPSVVFEMRELIYLDIRFNKFYGPLPPQVFDAKLDAIFVNNNEFDCQIPTNLGNSPASVVVLANNKLVGELPRSIGKMGKTLNELVVLNNGVRGALPSEVGRLYNVDLFDVSVNNLTGKLPESLKNLYSLEIFNVGENQLTGGIMEGICKLPEVRNLTFRDNFFTKLDRLCLDITKPPRNVIVDISGNCIPGQEDQKPAFACRSYLGTDCSPSDPSPVPWP